MKLSSLIKDLSLVSPACSGADRRHDPEITSITSDSRNVRSGGLFIAVKGLLADGHDFISQAFEKGAVAVVAQANPKKLDRVLLVENSRRAMAAIAAGFYGHPSKDLVLVGITGTNGKTTTTWLLESIFKACGFPTGVIGTINIRYGNQIFDAPVTTPDAIDLQKNLFDMKKAGITHVIMEVSSHGLALNRVDFCQFDAGIFTNLTQDHLDYHRDMDSYFECKKRFFTHFLGPKGKNNAPAVLNIDDPKGELLSTQLTGPTLTVSTKKKADIAASEITDDIYGLAGTIRFPEESIALASSLTGTFNLENILCAAGAASALNIDTDHIKKGLEDCRVIPGRLEKIDTDIDRFLFVDYAHTPDALESILVTLAQRAPKRVITIFGCGGDRDRSKRPLMGRIACKHSDIAIVTSDNPRTEHPESIVDDILKGLDACDRLSARTLESTPFEKGYLVEVDRKKAIQKAVFISKPGDIIVAAGKGHETYQITNAGTIHFDDKEELQKAAREFTGQFAPIPWTIADLSAALNSRPAASTIEADFIFSGISTDSRSIRQSQVFLALKGDSFDGHTFINRLVDKGIKGFVAETGFLASLDTETKSTLLQKNIVVFETEDTLTALGGLARHQRIRSNVKLLAITGSSGKTTTRKISEEIFKTQFHILATAKNFNNEIGVPLTLLNLSDSHEWAIVEMGMNHPGEISRLSRMALPDITLVTNTAGAHLEGLGTVNNVAAAKAEIFDGIRKKGTVVLFADDPRRHIFETAAEKNKNIDRLIFFGSDSDAEIQAAKIETSGTGICFTARLDNRETEFSIHSPALFMVNNCLAAIGAAIAAGVCPEGIRKGISAFTPVAGRMSIYKMSGALTLIDDTYNANPDSMTQALTTLQTVSAGKNSIAVLGDMLELGEASGKLHWDIGKKAASSGISRLYVFGEQIEHLIDGAVENGFSRHRIFHGTKKKIAQQVLKNLDADTWVLVKGSRGMAMEKVIQELRQILTVNS